MEKALRHATEASSKERLQMLYWLRRRGLLEVKHPPGKLMQEHINNSLRLGRLINPQDKQV